LGGEGESYVGEFGSGLERHRFRTAPAAYEGERADVGEHQVGEQVRRLGRGGTADGGALLAPELGQRRRPQGEGGGPLGGGVVGHLVHVQPGQPLGERARLAGRRGGQ